MYSKILIATTTWWPSTARLAEAFLRAGSEVAVIAPRGNPAWALGDALELLIYEPFGSLPALERAIERAAPDLIVPTDDRTVRHLQALHAQAVARGKVGQRLCEVIERSLGAPGFYAVSGSRAGLLELLSRDGIRAAETIAVKTPENLRRWQDERGFPFVLKIEGSWGGSGVALVRGPDEAEPVFDRMRRPLSLKRALRLLLVDRDAFPMAQFLSARGSDVVAQTYIEGPQANLMALAWNGKLISCLSVDVVRAQGQTGAAHVVTTRRCGEMEAAARHVAERLGVSGFFGLDFIIEAATNRPVLIEMNPRATQLGHLDLGQGSLADHLLACVAGRPQGDAAAPPGERTIAFFPQALRFEEPGPPIPDAALDIPWSQPELVRELLRRPWTKRSLLSRIETTFSHNPAYGRPIDSNTVNTILERLRQHAGRVSGPDASGTETEVPVRASEEMVLAERRRV